MGLTLSRATHAYALEVAQSCLEGSASAGASFPARALDAAQPAIGVHCHVGKGEEDVALLACLLQAAEKGVV